MLFHAIGSFAVFELSERRLPPLRSVRSFGERPLVKFKIQGTFTVDDKACVFGRPDRDGDFTVASSSRLDGVPLLERLEIPPKLRRPELDSVVGFILADPAALSRFHKFDVVELTL